MTRPVFLLSLPRAGSTLLQRLLLMSGKCATLGEPSLLLRFLGEDVAMTRKATYWESLVETATADMRKAWGGYDEAYRKGVRELMLGIYDGLAEGKEWFLDKTPRYTLIGEEILATFPDAKFIVLWRHPLAVASSVSSTFRKGRWCPDEFGIDLYEGQQRLQDFCEKHGERVFQIKYEDLVTDPAAELASLGEYLGWENLAAVLEEDLVTSTGGTLGDPTGVKRYNKISPDSRDAWKKELSNWYRRSWAREYVSGERARRMKQLGYELPDGIAHGGSFGLWAGIVDWIEARRRISRRLRRPTWLPRFLKKFRKERGYEVSFR